MVEFFSLNGKKKQIVEVDVFFFLDAHIYLHIIFFSSDIDVIQKKVKMSNDETNSTAVKSDKKKTICGACNSELEPDHSGIQCIQAHHFCPDCSVQIVNLFFSDPHNYIPLRCVQCHVELNPSVFERQLTNDQLDFYNMNMLFILWERQLSDNERFDHCPFCSYGEIHDKNDPWFMYCRHPDCKKMSCLICRKACPQFTSCYANDEQNEEMDRHFKCTELAKDKAKFDQALEAGQKVSCPNCNLAGMKDDACTHMTCPTCSQLWCYFCGKKVEDCDKQLNGNNGIFDHNRSWDTNAKRCPMYLTQISDVDPAWPDGDESLCLMRFHRIRSLRLLREVYTTLGEHRMTELDDHFHLLRSCGFTLDEILKEDLTLIHNRDNR